MANVNELQVELSLSNNQLSELFEVNLSTVGRWKNGKSKCDKSVIMCLESIRDKAPVIIPTHL